MTGPEALALFHDWAHQHGVPFTMQGNKACAEYTTVTLEFFRVPDGYAVRVVESKDQTVRRAERVMADGAHVSRTRVDATQGYDIVAPDWFTAIREALESAHREAMWWNVAKNLF